MSFHNPHRNFYIIYFNPLFSIPGRWAKKAHEPEGAWALFVGAIKAYPIS